MFPQITPSFYHFFSFLELSSLLFRYSDIHSKYESRYMRKRVGSETNKKKYEAFETEIMPHLNALQSFALKMTNDSEDSEDLLQDTLLKAFRFFDKFEKGTNAKAWLFQIMKNSFINNYRKNSKEPNKVDYEDFQNFYETIQASDVKATHFVGDAFSDILDDEIATALSVLPDDFRTIVFLSDIEGYTYEEIADFMDCPVGTVRSRLHRARKMLYALLYQYAQNHGFVESEVSNSKQSSTKLVLGNIKFKNSPKFMVN